VCRRRNIVAEANSLIPAVKSSRFFRAEQSRRNCSNLHFHGDGMFLAEVDCCHIVRGLPNESHKVRIDIDFRVVRVRESRKSHMILPVAKVQWRMTIAPQQTCTQCEQAEPALGVWKGRGALAGRMFESATPFLGIIRAT